MVTHPVYIHICTKKRREGESLENKKGGIEKELHDLVTFFSFGHLSHGRRRGGREARGWDRDVSPGSSMPPSTHDPSRFRTSALAIRYLPLTFDSRRR